MPIHPPKVFPLQLLKQQPLNGIELVAHFPHDILVCLVCLSFYLVLMMILKWQQGILKVRSFFLKKHLKYHISEVSPVNIHFICIQWQTRWEFFRLWYRLPNCPLERLHQFTVSPPAHQNVHFTNHWMYWKIWSYWGVKISFILPNPLAQFRTHQTFSVKGQRVNILGFWAVQPIASNWLERSHSECVNKWAGCVLVKLDL